jgi:cell division protein FtsI/penicillin-binding protein 2
MNRKSANPESQKNSYNVRIFLLLSVITVFFIFIALRLFNLQILSHDHYETLASNQHGSQSTIDPKRGDIYLSSFTDANPLLVATNITKDSVFAVPKNIPDKTATAKKLAPLLDFSTADLTSRISGNGSYVLLKKQLDSDTSTKIKALKLTGIYLESADTRFYPENNLASQVIGFVGFKGNDRVGQYGVEGKFEGKLAGQKGSLGADTDTSGVTIASGSKNFLPAQDGDDVYLTIDPAIQIEAQKVLSNTVKEHGADSGSVVVVDPKNGEILAMANAPDFDPNNYGKVKDPAIFSNPVLSGEYEPGSIFKAITMAAALNENKVTPETIFNNTGTLQIDDKKINNSDPTELLGDQSMITVLDQSLNTGAVFAEQQIGNDTFKKYVQKFGFGKAVDFELAGQTPGNIDNLNKKGDIFFATASYGQGITVTPLQMVQAYSAIANGGKMMKPYILNKIVHPDGSEEVTKPADGINVIDSKTATALSGMLVDVVENGHGKKAAVKGYCASRVSKQGWVRSKYKHWFVYRIWAGG